MADYSAMVFVPPPHTVQKIIGLSMPKLMLGYKEKRNQSTWRVLTDFLKGKTSRLQQKTIETIAEFTVENLCIHSPPSMIVEIFKHPPEGTLWEVAAISLEKGIKASAPEHDTSLDLFGKEAVQMEKIAYEAVKQAVEQDDLRIAVDLISRWKLCRLPSLQWVIGNIDTSSQKRFSETAFPLTIYSTLYLLACWYVDWFGTDTPKEGISIMPEQRGSDLVRPMTRWLEGIETSHILTTRDALADFLLCKSSGDLEDKKREIRKWRNQGEIPSWSRVKVIVNSLGKRLGEENREQIQTEVTMSLAMVRIVDALLTASIEIQKRWLPDYDPLAPFKDAPLIFDYARGAKAALLQHAKQ